MSIEYTLEVTPPSAPLQCWELDAGEHGGGTVELANDGTWEASASKNLGAERNEDDWRLLTKPGFATVEGARDWILFQLEFDDFAQGVDPQADVHEIEE